jgi:hypothetical protein
MTVNGTDSELEGKPELDLDSDTLPEFKRHRESLFIATNATDKVLHNCYDASSDACTIATVLDPRLTLEYFQPARDKSKEDSSNTHEPKLIIKKVITSKLFTCGRFRIHSNNFFSTEKGASY